MARFTVTNNNNSGAGSLRQAIIDAGNVVGVDIIDLTSVSGTINLNSSLGNLNTGNDINFVDDGNTTISGQNASGQNAYQILAVNGASVTFSRLTFANGLARGGDGNNGGGGGLGAGGALFINAGNVTLNNVTFSGNRAVGGNANGNAGSGGSTGSNGSHGGNGGGLNSTTGGLGGSGGTRSGNNGNPGAEGGAGGFGAGGGGGGGGGGATSGNFFNDPDDGGGNGGNGGNAGFGGGGGGGGGGGNDYDFHSGNEHGRGGNRGTGGHSDGGNGSDGAGGDNRTGGRGGGGAGLGGAIFVNSGASLTLLNSVFTGNSVTGGTGANNGQADGANIFVNGGTVQSIGTTATIARDYTNVKYTNNGTINAVSFPTNPYEYNRSIYRLTTAGTWQQAQAQAQSLGGNLVTVNNQAEQDWLVTTFGSEQLWIGLTDEVTEGQFRWASGETSTYTNWFPGEPNNAWNEDYVHMYSNAYGNGKWNDSGSTASFRGIIENKFFEYNGSRYLLTGSGTWKQAQDQAQSLGGNLVTVNNQAEQDWLVSTFGGSEQLWIGLTDEVTEGQFRWASGETSTFTNWLPGEPNNVGNEDYVGMNFDGAGKWNDYSSTSSQRGIIEINQYGATGRNADSQFFVLAKPEPFTISVIGGFGPDIFQLRSYDGLTTSQQVSGGQGSDVFNISLEGSSGTVGLNFNTGKLKDLAELLVTPDWDVREKRRAADISAATIHAGIDYAAAALQAADITGLADGAIDAIATTAHLAIDLANIQINYNLDIEEYQNNLKGIGDFFSGQGANGWGTVNVTQRRSIVEIMDFQPGIDTITLPKLTGNQAYRYTLVSGINGTGVEVAYNNQTNEPSTFLRIYIDPTLLPIVQGQNVGVTQFIESLFTNNATNAVIGTTRNNTSKVAVSGASYTGTMAGDYIYVAQNNPTVGSVKIYGLAGDDLLAGRKNGTNEIYGGDGDDFIVPGGVNDTIDGGAGYDQVNYSQNAVGISFTSSNSTNFKNVESVTGTVYNDTINFSDLQVAPDDGLPINLEGRAGNDSLVGSQYQDVIDGEDGNDTLIGGAGSDILKGGAGDDILNPGYSQGSTDTVDGGDGNDLLQVDYSNKTSASVGIHLGFQNNNVIYHRSGTNGDNYELVKFSNIERFDITGTQYDDAFEGRSGNDTFNGGAGNDFLDGGDGNDILDGGAGTDTQIGGKGDDTYIVDSTTDTVTENANEGIDTIQSSVTLTLATNVENLTLTGTAAINGTGNAGNNVITGNGANNTLDGGAGIDTLIGGLGDDIYIVDSTTDTITENANAGIDTIQSSVTYTILAANVENLTLTGTAAINGTGNAGNNVITGNGANNTLDGGAGNDTLIGGLGDDIYIVDSATDTVTENVGEGIDTIQSSATFTLATNVENLTLTETAAINGTGNELSNVITGNGANNTLDGGAGIDTLIAGLGDDIYVVDSTTDTITENANEGIDTIQSSVTLTLATNVENLTLTGTAAINGTGNELSNVITGNGANNTLDGGAGNDTLIGGLGDDIYIVDSATDTVTENVGEGIDTIQSSVTLTLATNVENLTLTGTAAINGTGNELSNVITGNGANNTLDGGAGNDTLIGGTGDDIYVVDSTTDIITELANEGTDTIQSSVTLTLATNVENLTLTGTAVINGTGNELNNVITGNAANNILDGGAGIDTLIGGLGDDIYVVDSATEIITENANEGTDTIQSSVTLTLATNVENLTITGTAAINGTGNELNNVITGNAGNNILDGGAGNDTLDGGAGTDTLIGGLGDDIYVVDSTTDIITELANGGTDTIQSSVTYTIAAANVENLTLTGTAAINGTGNAGNNVITGNGANNILNGGAGTDTLIGGLGNDIYVVDSTTDTITENASGGTDTIQSSVTYTIATLALANVENLTLTGAAAINGTGNAANNVITGNSANNTLDGGAGNDTLDGGAGTDTLIGGLGNDIYIVDSTTDIITELANGGTDTIQSSVTYTIAAANVENLTLTGTTAINGTGSAGNNVITGNAGNNILTGGLGKDTLTGGLGVDRFDYRTLANSALGIFDVITDFNATTGNDLFLVTTARSGFNNVTTSVATLDATGIAARLTTAVFTANSAAQFTFGTRTFVAINDGNAGFSATTDAIIEVTGLTGTLGTSNFTTTLV